MIALLANARLLSQAVEMYCHEHGVNTVDRSVLVGEPNYVKLSPIANESYPESYVLGEAITVQVGAVRTIVFSP